jgi:hypothetical protein
MTRIFAAVLAAFSLTAPAAPAAPTRDEALGCWLMTHPSRDRLRVTHWPQAEPKGERIA